MAAPTIGRRPGFVRASATVDWSHPLATGLKMYVRPGVSKSDLVDGSLLTVDGGDVFASSTRFGVAGKAVGATWARLKFVNFSRFDVPTGGGFTMFVCGGVSGSTRGLFALEGGTPIISLSDTGTSVRFRTRNDANSLDDLTATSTGVDTSILCLSGVWAAGAKSLYVDSKAPVTSSSSGSITTFTAGGIYGENGSVSPATIVAAAFWNRALSAGEVAQLHADPFAMLRY